MSLSDSLRRMLPIMLILLLVATWLGGGVTADSTPADQWLQLLALPILAVAGWSACLDGINTRLQRVALGAALLVCVVPAAQLLPLPTGIWHSAVPRHALSVDLRQAGVSDLYPYWSLTPGATEAALWALLPAMAALLATLALSGRQRRLMIKVILLLVLGNVLFAFFQAGLPADSALRLYPARDAGFGGLFANTNHHATALLVGMVLAAGQAVHGWRRQQAGRGHPHAWAWYAVFAGACFTLMPLTTSRAGMVLALPALAAILLLCGAVPLRRRGRGLRGLGLLLGTAAFAAVGVVAAMGWMAVDHAEELRHAMLESTSALGAAHAPFGSGVGSFVPVFEQAASSRFWMDAYVNHAHNEYVQWWLEAGWLGVLAIMAAMMVMAMAGWQILRTLGRDGNAILAASCFVAVCAVLAHSWADFPLRTTALMATTATLFGLMLGALADVRSRAEQPDHASMQAIENAQPS